MSSEEYSRYMASREWAVKRQAVRRRSEGICERCHKAPMQSVHHLTYAHIFHEPLDELLGICDACHSFLSGRTKHDPSADGPFEAGSLAARFWQLSFEDLWHAKQRLVCDLIQLPYDLEFAWGLMGKASERGLRMKATPRRDINTVSFLPAVFSYEDLVRLESVPALAELQRRNGIRPLSQVPIPEDPNEGFGDLSSPTGVFAPKIEGNVIEIWRWADV